MRFAIVACLVAALSSQAEASFISSGTSVVPGYSATVTWGVWQGNGTDIPGTSTSVAVGEYIYMYQLSNDSTPGINQMIIGKDQPIYNLGTFEDLTFDFDADSLVDTNVGSTAFETISPDSSAIFGGTTSGFFYNDAVGITDIMYFYSKKGPGAGVGIVGFSDGVASFQAAVPVPLPVSALLAVVGLPFAWIIKRRIQFS